MILEFETAYALRVASISRLRYGRYLTSSLGLTTNCCTIAG